MCLSSNSNIVFPCKICNINIKDKDSVVQCDISNKLSHIDYRYLEGSNDPCHCISCCNEIYPFGTLTDKNFLSLANYSPPDDSFTKNSDTYISKNSSLSLKLSSNLYLLFNQLNNFTPEQKKALKTL